MLPAILIIVGVALLAAAWALFATLKPNPRPGTWLYRLDDSGYALPVLAAPAILGLLLIVAGIALAAKGI